MVKLLQNGLSANIKLSKIQLHEIVQSGGYLGTCLRPLLKTGLPLLGNVFKLSAKSVLTPLGLTVAASATDAGTDASIHKKYLDLVIQH